AKTVTIHISCTGDTTLFKKVPITRTEIIRALIADGLIQNGTLPIQARSIAANYDLLDFLAKVMATHYDQSLPMVYISKVFDNAGYNADTEKLARYLAGVAYIVAEESRDLAFNLKEKTGGANPFNGHIAIYYPNGKIDRIKPSEVQVWGAADSRIMEDIVKVVTAQVDKESVSWEQLNSEINASLLDDFMNGYDSLESKLKAAKERIATLTKENAVLQSKNESLQAAFDASGIEESIITKAPIKEFFEGEQHDLLVTILKEAAMRNGSFDTRKYELINSLLENNEYIGGGHEIEDVVKCVLSSGEQINKRDIAELERIGFKLVAEQNHYKIVYRGNERYWFTISKSPSDGRSGYNNASDIIKRLTVY
ncbi:MAG: cell division protein ZapB, partial [Roseburia sp.]|nr:cell division protein ZapB [Roseburia sp.]